MAAVIKQPLDIEQYKVNGIEPINAQDMREHSLLSADETEPSSNGNKGWIKPGQVLNPNGRKPGSRNALSEAFVRDVHHLWMDHGLQALTSMLSEEPTKFCQLVAQIIPKDFQVSVDDGNNVRWVINANPAALSTSEWAAMHGLNQSQVIESAEDNEPTDT